MSFLRNILLLLFFGGPRKFDVKCFTKRRLLCSYLMNISCNRTVINLFGVFFCLMVNVKRIISVKTSYCLFLRKIDIGIHFWIMLDNLPHSELDGFDQNGRRNWSNFEASSWSWWSGKVPEFAMSIQLFHKWLEIREAYKITQFHRIIGLNLCIPQTMWIIKCSSFIFSFY